MTVKVRTDVYDHPVVVLESVKCSSAHVESPHRINVQNCAECVRRQVFRCAEKVARRAIYENIQRAVRLHGKINCGTGIFWSTDIPSDEFGINTVRREHPYCLLQDCLSPSHDDDLGAVKSKLTGNLLPNARSPASDQRDAAAACCGSERRHGCDARWGLRLS
ncbi:hypothetical protein H310_01956 [Aphanomyces invadans]|uniref:Uncharacterized protein n=1 Tax=Aphanomyces invadans TaxID=157072 RepID=A0A024UNN8_9STRA|nr:hypothetical protein H310_01956 [Aphanomyces invadans]ETW07442.1 hypothetical protein H310_01956 [Aphanomyces invadans]|eukprot:XP_008863535.1 hypothetical protein H310_01956 [Aphanomyces invadans]